MGTREEVQLPVAKTGKAEPRNHQRQQAQPGAFFKCAEEEIF